LWITESSEAVGYSYSETTLMGGFAIPWTDYSTDPMGLAFTGNGTAVGVLRSQVTTDAGTMGELRFVRWTGGTWTPGFGQAALPVQPFPTLYISGGPSIAGSSTRAHAAFQGTDGKFYYAEYFNGSWSPMNEAMTAGTTQSVGPAPPAIVTLNDTPIAVFVGNDGDLYDQTRSGGTWQAAKAHGVAGHVASITPRIVALTQGAELLIVYTDSAADNLSYTIRSSGTWSAPLAITGATSANVVALAPLAAGGAVLSFQGTDSHLYTVVLSAGAPFTWTAPAKGVMGADPVLVGPPAVATGATGAQAELLYLDNSGYVLYSARMNGGAWGPATYAGTASANLALATGN
jgi:hypothetical protein